MIEGRPSRTALWIASNVLILDKAGTCDYLPDGIAPLQKAVLSALHNLNWLERFFLFVLCDNYIFCRFFVWLVSACVVKNGIEVAAFRKSYFEQQVRDFLGSEEEPQQVLVLAAGYDTLSLRLANQYPKTSFWEIDHPATGRFKDRLWQDQTKTENAAPQSKPKRSTSIPALTTKPQNLFHAHVDLVESGSLVKTLQENHPSYDVSKPTIVIMEGLLSYLSKQQIQQLFRDIARVVGENGSIVAFNAVIKQKQTGKSGAARIDFGWFSWIVSVLVQRGGEPFLMGMDPETIPEFFQELGGVESSSSAAAAQHQWKLRGAVQSFAHMRLATVGLQQ